MHTLRKIALALVIIGAINWGLIGLFQFDLVASLFGGQDAALSRLIYGLVGVSGLICLSYYFDEAADVRLDDRSQMNRPNYGTEFSDEFDRVEKHEENNRE